MKELAGRIAVITGGATGIGRSLALALARNGMHVVIASTNRARLESTVKEICAIGPRASAVVCDVSDRASVRNLATQVLDEYGAVHLLVANAGVTTTGAFLDHRDEDWDWIYEVVLRGVTHCIQAFYPITVKQGEGQIVIVGSQAGLVPDWMIGHGPYTSAKAGVMALAVALRPEAAAHGVGISLLIPAGVETDILQSARSRPARYGTSFDGKLSKRPGAPSPAPGSKTRLTPDEFAEIAIDGIKRNTAIIATHPGLKPLVEEYFARILAAYDADYVASG